MTEDGSFGETLKVTRVFAAPQEKVFRAWTEPEQLKKWWRPGEGWTTPLAEVDLRTGGKFALGAQPPAGDLHVVRGEFREVAPPERLVYTWRVDGTSAEENIVTVEFHTRGGGTEVTITHQQLTEESAATSRIGWIGVLGSLQQLLG